ncbi:MAG TPA: metallopeptidase TldD-related protein [Kofleriaceae bacterium]|nr:metallopeptidase TldD-related protein [Kofleriaceae bacterium]
MTFHRREVLGALGAASASTLLWALGCGARSPAIRRAPQVSGEVRTWLRDAVARLIAVYPTVHALAVSRRRTTAALDVLGAGIARTRIDGAVFTVRRTDGSCREHVTSDLSAAGIDEAVTALGAPRERKSLDFGRAPPTPDEPPHLDDSDLRHRAELLQRHASASSRIVYAAALIDIDDAILWSVAPRRDLEQRLTRIRHTATCAAWNGSRAVVREAERAWSGWLDDQPLTPADIDAARDAALQLMTPGIFDDGERTLVLDPSAAALLLDTAATHLLTSAAARHPAVARRAAIDAHLASPLVTLVDDPTTPAAYGAFAFDDEGEPAAAITLLDQGRIAARLTDHTGSGAGRGRRPGHLALVEPAPPHLRLSPGSFDTPQLYTDGFILEGALSATYDPDTDHFRLACARARELKSANETGRIYADVELVGSLSALLAAIDGIARDPATLAPHTHPTQPPLWRSISTPALRTRGFLRASRPPRTRT